MSTLSEAPDDLGIITGEAVALEVRATSWPLRALGALIDVTIGVLVFIGLLIAVGWLADLAGVDDAATRALVIVDVVLCFVIGPTIVETASHGRSIGKLAIGSRIVRDDGGAIGIRHAFIRSLTGLVELVLTFGGLAALVGLFNRRSKRVGDLLAGTVSQHERVPRPPSNAVGVPTSLTEWAKVADVARLPDRLSRRIAAFLAQAPMLAPASRERLAHDLAAEAAPFVAPAVEAPPELLLAAISAIRREREYTALTLEQARFAELQKTMGPEPHGFPDR